ncbi:NAD(P)-binding domain-containing protein [Pajaroellobacter abortibovis]|uniref:6-phosphogluconate dehydrogenase NADP-binding domain-containing protein n=1 Tax=Pajaroellobacter abortibovis TaxID=1882918 RepID=A0A1L6MVX0_9BACT|nr:NAD(P)-binding domain-containing protein [Pajaroellobacter abortibovis]APR99672.1 hypothetical protein BCY86_02515 [Pajaroellobacter abortibovis]
MEKLCKRLMRQMMLCEERFYILISFNEQLSPQSGQFFMFFFVFQINESMHYASVKIKSMMKHIGVIGLGIMGAPMAQRLLEHGSFILRIFKE